MIKSEYIIALDTGTTSTKGMLYRIDGGIECVRSQTYRTYYPGPNMVEQDPEEVLGAVVKVVHDIISDNRINPAAVSALVFCGILHSFLPVDRDGNPLSRAIIWGDSRCTEQSGRLRKELNAETVKSRTGCGIHPLYYLPRLAWFHEEAGDLFNKTFKIISIKEFILFHLFKQFLIDRSTASGTGIWNMSNLKWDDELLSSVGIKTGMFSRIEETTFTLQGLGKEYALRMGLLEGTPGVIGAADGPSAHLGSVGLADNAMSITIGTSGALRRRLSKPEVIPGLEAWCYYLTEGNWLLGGVTHDAGMVMKWLFNQFIKESINKAESLDAINAYASEIGPGAGGLLFFPFFGGERSPHYNPSARGAVLGLSFNHGKKHLIRALMEGISYRLYSNYRMLAPGDDLELIVSGGILKSAVWLQITADFFGKKLWKPDAAEASAFGAVLIALRALGVINSIEKVNEYVGHSGFIDFDAGNHKLYQKICRSYDDIYSRLFL